MEQQDQPQTQTRDAETIKHEFLTAATRYGDLSFQAQLLMKQMEMLEQEFRAVAKATEEQ